MKTSEKNKNWWESYDWAGSFSEGRAPVRLGEKWGHVDFAGKVTTMVIYDDVGYFSEGRAWVQLGDKWGHVDLGGKYEE